MNAYMYTTTEFMKRFPEFAGVDLDMIEMALEDTAELMGVDSPERWLNFFGKANAYYAAHWLLASLTASDGDSDAMSPVKTKTVDNVAISFAVGDSSVALEDLYSSTYGKRYLLYRKICFAGIRGV